MSSRSTQTLTRTAAAAFDFDVVSDVSPRPVRKPDVAPDSAQPDPAREKAKAEKP
jgi:hypothetical protein